jgi:hypothetical protein
MKEEEKECAEARGRAAVVRKPCGRIRQMRSRDCANSTTELLST